MTGRAACHLRSPVRSECHPFNCWVMKPATYGIAARRVTFISLNPESRFTMIGSIEHGHRLGTILVTEPVGQVDDHSRQEPGFGGAHQETHPIKLSRRVNESHQHGYDSPGNHDAGDPAPCTPSLHDQRTRNFQQEVSKKENASAEANYTGAETEVSRHLQSRRSNVHSIQKSNHVEHNQKG